MSLFDGSRVGPGASARARDRRRVGPAVLAVLAVLATVAGLLVAGPATAAPTTVVTLTFDDGNADQMTAASTLKTYGLKGTFYVISGSVGAPGYLTRANLATLAANGNEIGGHTVSHADLTTVPIDEAKRQICNDRATLTGWGYKLTSFAYPYAAYDAAVEQAASECGYNSARTLGDIASAHGCAGCDTAGTIPPADPYNVAAVDMIDNTWTLAQMKAVVTTAEKTGGWVPFTFHHICSGTGCDSISVSPTVFSQFALWLKTRPFTTTVKTVDQVIGGTVKPVVTGPPAPGGLSVRNPSLETAGTGAFPQCWFPGGYGTNTVAWTRASSGSRTGTYSEQLAMSGYSSGDAKLLPTFDLGSCSPAITAGRSYTLGTWYKSSAASQFSVYYRDAAGGWYYWTSSPWFAAASTWTQATWTTPAAPAGATGISFGLGLFSNGSLTTDDYTLTEPGAAAPAAVIPAARLAATAVQAVPAGTTATVGAAASTGTAVSTAVPPRGTGRGRVFKRRWARGDRALLPGGRQVRPGTRVAIPFEPYSVAG